MIGFLKTWIISVAAAAVVSSAAIALTPAGRFKRITSLAAGLLMITALVGPVLKLDMGSFAGYTAAFKYEAEKYIESLENTNEKLTSLIICGDTEAYILDKAKMLEMEVTDVTVTVREDEEGMLFPFAVELTTSAPSEKRDELSYFIEADLAIPKERQRWTSDED